MFNTLIIPSGSNLGAIFVPESFKYFSIAIRNKWGFEEGIYLSDEQVAELKDLCSVYLQEVEYQNTHITLEEESNE